MFVLCAHSCLTLIFCTSLTKNQYAYSNQPSYNFDKFQCVCLLFSCNFNKSKHAPLLLTCSCITLTNYSVSTKLNPYIFLGKNFCRHISSSHFFVNAHHLLRKNFALSLQVIDFLLTRKTLFHQK